MILHHTVPEPLYCPCNWDLDAMELDTCQLAYRTAYKFCCDDDKGSSVLGTREQQSNFYLYNYAKEHDCDWCKDLMKRHGEDIIATMPANLFDCHKGANTQQKILDYRAKKELENIRKLADPDFQSTLNYP